MKIRFLSDVSADKEYKAGNVYEVAKLLADSFIQTGWAKEEKRVHEAEGREGPAEKTAKARGEVRK